jgi:hypothetical protein
MITDCTITITAGASDLLWYFGQGIFMGVITCILSVAGWRFFIN